MRTFPRVCLPKFRPFKALGKARLLRASDLLLELLRTGRMMRFEQDFYKLTGLPRHVAYRALHRAGATGIGILCGAFGLDRAIFSEMYFHLRGVTRTRCPGPPSNTTTR